MTLSDIKSSISTLKDAEQLHLLNWFAEYLGPAATQKLHRELSSKDKGLESEIFIAAIVGGRLTTNGFKYDVDSGNGSQLEVKHSRYSPWKGGSKNTRDWTWRKPFGEKGEKVYDRLILEASLTMNGGANTKIL